MRIMVRLGEPLWRAAGTQRLDLEFAGGRVTVADVVALLTVTYPPFAAAYRGEGLGRPWPYNLFVNARQVPADQEHEFELADGDKVYFFLPAVGGNGASGPLPRSFYQRPTLEVARSLLGQLLVRSVDGQRLSGRVREVEAYIGEDDQASHAARGRTERNRAMYAVGGTAYVYFIYGMHYCLNVVTEAEGFPAAVLIRRIEPVEGVEFMAARRPGQPRSRLADGPAKLCQALAIGRSLDGHDLTAGTDLWLEPGEPVPDDQVLITPRINVVGDERARTAPWRYVWQPGGAELFARDHPVEYNSIPRPEPQR